MMHIRNVAVSISDLAIIQYVVGQVEQINIKSIALSVRDSIKQGGGVI